MVTRRDPPSSTPPRQGDRIAKLLARAGVASRREVERMIAEGRVARDGVPIDTPNTVLPSLRGVTVDGQPVAAPAPARLFLYHKPVGLLVTERDPAGRPTIYDRLPADLPRVVPVGRLDLNTEGLLLLTTDGGLKRQLELPASGVERTYRARAYGDVTQAQLEELIEGVEIDGIRYGQIDANLERRTGANVWIELTLTEGKNREVRRVLEHLGLQVGRLIRIRYGPFILGDLPVGEVGEVRQHDLVAFRQSLTGKRGGSTDPIVAAPVRQPRRAVSEEEAAPAPSPRPRQGTTTAGDRRAPRAAPGPRGNDVPGGKRPSRTKRAPREAGTSDLKAGRRQGGVQATGLPGRGAVSSRDDHESRPDRSSRPARPAARQAGKGQESPTDRSQSDGRRLPTARRGQGAAPGRGDTRTARSGPTRPGRSGPGKPPSPGARPPRGGKPRGR